VSFAINPLQPTPMDSLTAVGCAPQTLHLVFKKNIQCNSIAANGSDFIVTGPSPVSVISAQGSCNNGESSVINVVLSAPIVNGGNYQIKLVTGSDGNTILDECAQETPAGSALSFTTKDTVSADFTYAIFQSCLIDSIEFFHDGRNGVNKWFWNLDDGGISSSEYPIARYTNFGTKQIRLIVS